MRSRIFFVLLILLFHTNSFCQKVIKGFIADSVNHRMLPFASIHFVKLKTGMISGIDASFLINSDLKDTIRFSYTGYESKTTFISDIKNGDTVLLTPKKSSLKEVVIVSNGNKIKRIINNTIDNKDLNNPDKYKKYECNVYYKMIVSVIDFPTDSIIKNRKNRRQAADTVRDSLPDFLTDKSYLMLSETYSKRMYERPQKINEVILASRFSGLKKTYFANIITDVLPFHIYNNFIKLNDQDYQSPIAKGWESKYNFTLDDEIYEGNDTTYVLSYAPKKNKIFASLKGMVYINKNGYAISHMTGATTDTVKKRQISFEQIYSKQSGRWFPQELNYSFVISKVFSSKTEIKITGHSLVDSIKFDSSFSRKTDHSRPIIIDNSVDNKSQSDWEKYRKDSLSKKEMNTYHVIDSFVTKNHIEKIILLTSKLGLNKIPIGSFDLDVNRLLKSNEYEGLRPGVGLYSNNKISKYFSLGGWIGYGIKDNGTKGGASFKIFPCGNKNNWLQIEAEHDYRKRGDLNLFKEVNKRDGTNWILRSPDVVDQITLSANLTAGYLQINPEFLSKRIHPSTSNDFSFSGMQLKDYNSKEINVGVRYAFGEKRIPVGDEYIPYATKFPILYFRIGSSHITATNYSTDLIRAIATITYRHHTNRWGVDDLRIDGGNIFQSKQQPLPASFLFSANGLKTSNTGFYFQGGFITIAPDLYFNDQFVSVFYKHDFDKFLWQTKCSKPYLSLCHNVLSGSISGLSLMANKNIMSINGAYHETGFLVNQLIKYNLHIADLPVGGGFYHHWQSGKRLSENNVFVISVGAVF